ncbi:MAG: hypothetical protein ACFE0O_00935 [Opitutales bacterium]
MSKRSKNKTVYVLGAGFSAGAGLPVQSRILGNILSKLGYSFSGILATETEEKFQQDLDEKIAQLSTFIETSFPHPDQLLEDIFTLLEQTIAADGHFKGFGRSALQEIRATWIDVLVGYFHALTTGYLESGATVGQRFTAALLQKRIQAGLESDQISIVSLNWDSLIEDSFYQVLEQTGGIGKGDIDFCIYTSPLEDSPHTPSTKQKAGGIFNLKLLKLHGSTNWLRCPNSNRIYTALGSAKNPYELYVCPRKSPFIEEHFTDSGEAEDSPFLEPFIITPSFSKVFDQPHIQTTWQNAYVELREASKIVFIGYSLPDADYHFRTLLRRAIRDETELLIVLHSNDAPTVENPDEMEEETNRIEELHPEPSPTILRYEKLFGKKKVEQSVRFNGMEALVDEMLPESEFTSALSFIKEQLIRHKTYKDFQTLPEEPA